MILIRLTGSTGNGTKFASEIFFSWSFLSEVIPSPVHRLFNLGAQRGHLLEE
jgi:hypothetical protein